jgi:hypothetical protein
MLLEQKEHSFFFENKTGLKQDDSLSTVLFSLALQEVPSGIKMVKEQLNILAYADNFV